MCVSTSILDSLRIRFGKLEASADEAATSLALLRILIPPFMLLAPGFRESERVAGWVRDRWAVPEGPGWFVNHVPIRPDLALVAEMIAAIAALHAMVGLCARAALAVLALSSFYLYSIAELTGFAWHDIHLLWMAALLAASPCDHLLAVDARGVVPGAPYSCIQNHTTLATEQPLAQCRPVAAVVPMVPHHSSHRVE